MNWNQGAEQFLEALSSDNPTPGGGAAAAMAGAMGCALILMAIGTTLKRKSTPKENLVSLQAVQQKIRGLHTELKKLIQLDAQAYESYLVAKRLPTEEPSRQQALQDALWVAATVPADIATVALHLLQDIDTLNPLIASVILSDMQCAQHLLKTAIRCSLENIHINLQAITDPIRVEKLQKRLSTFERAIK